MITQRMESEVVEKYKYRVYLKIKVRGHNHSPKLRNKKKMNTLKRKKFCN